MKIPQNKTTSVCSLFEGDFALGFGALSNSLVQSGFQGQIWGGYRGPLPSWVTQLKMTGESRYFLAKDVDLNLIPVSTSMHLTHFKPFFVLDVLNRLDSQTDFIFFFDSDIIVKAKWSFFELWMQPNAVTLCEDIHPYMPANHPIRLFWETWAKELGLNVFRSFTQYFNGGFIGLPRAFFPFLQIWARLIEHAWGGTEELKKFRNEKRVHRTDPFMSANQDTLNITCMATEFPLSTIGPEGMGFTPGGNLMTHPLGQEKPWRKNMIYSALRGYPPTLADRAYWDNVTHPIVLHSSREKYLNRLNTMVASAIGRVNRRV